MFSNSYPDEYDTQFGYFNKQISPPLTNYFYNSNSNILYDDFHWKSYLNQLSIRTNTLSCYAKDVIYAFKMNYKAILKGKCTQQKIWEQVRASKHKLYIFHYLVLVISAQELFTIKNKACPWAQSNSTILSEMKTKNALSYSFILQVLLLGIQSTSNTSCQQRELCCYLGKVQIRSLGAGKNKGNSFFTVHIVSCDAILHTRISCQ